MNREEYYDSLSHAGWLGKGQEAANHKYYARIQTGVKNGRNQYLYFYTRDEYLAYKNGHKKLGVEDKKGEVESPTSTKQIKSPINAELYKKEPLKYEKPKYRVTDKLKDISFEEAAKNISNSVKNFFHDLTPTGRKEKKMVDKKEITSDAYKEISERQNEAKAVREREAHAKEISDEARKNTVRDFKKREADAWVESQKQKQKAAQKKRDQEEVEAYKESQRKKQEEAQKPLNKFFSDAKQYAEDRERRQKDKAKENRNERADKLAEAKKNREAAKQRTESNASTYRNTNDNAVKDLADHLKKGYDDIVKANHSTEGKDIPKQSSTDNKSPYRHSETPEAMQKTRELNEQNAKDYYKNLLNVGSAASVPIDNAGGIKEVAESIFNFAKKAHDKIAEAGKKFLDALGIKSKKDAHEEYADKHLEEARKKAFLEENKPEPKITESDSTKMAAYESRLARIKSEFDAEETRISEAYHSEIKKLDAQREEAEADLQRQYDEAVDKLTAEYEDNQLIIAATFAMDTGNQVYWLNELAKEYENNLQIIANNVDEYREKNITKPYYDALEKVDDHYDKLFKDLDDQYETRAKEVLGDKDYEDYKRILDKLEDSKELDILKEAKEKHPNLKVLDKVESSEDSQTAVNPNFTKDGVVDTYEELQYATNCTLCTMTYDLRQRGYDVEANPVTISEAMQGGISILDILSYYGIESNDDVNREVRSFEGCYKNPSAYAKEMEATILEEHGNGSRGHFIVSWKQGGGHDMVWECNNGRVTIIDAQNNERYAIEDVMAQSADAMWFRSDNKDISEAGIKRACHNRGEETSVEVFGSSNNSTSESTEERITALKKAGYSNAEIAKQTGYSMDTIKNA